jgi:hypothetical protein
MHKLVLVLALLATLPLVAQSTKKPWMLTLDERIALRTNPELARERVRHARRSQALRTPAANSPSSSSGVIPTVDAFDGQTHPELFLPHEVFWKVIKLAFMGTPRQGQLIREGFMPEVRRLGLPDDFWQRLQSVSAVYIADSFAQWDIGMSLQQQHGAARQRAENTLTLKQRDSCRSRADALAASRNEFGRERFDRFMYEVFAINMFNVEDRLPDAELLLKIEGGCR